MTSDFPWTYYDVEPAVLGRRIRAARRAAGLTQADVGGEEASVAYISRIESGQRRPSRRLLAAVAERLDVTVADLTDPGDADPHSDLRLTVARAELEQAQGAAPPLPHLSDLVARADTAGLRELGDRAAVVVVGVLLAEGRAPEATRTLTRRFGTAVDQLTSVRVCTLLSASHLEAGDVAEAVRAAERGAHLVDEYDLHGLPEALDLAAAHARALTEDDHPDQAAQVCRCALRAGRSVSSPHDLADAYLRASIQEASAGATSQAAAHLALAEAARVVDSHHTHLDPLHHELARALRRGAGSPP